MIIDIFKSFWEKSKLIPLMIEFLILFWIGYSIYGCQREELRIANHNIKASATKIDSLTKANGTLLYQKQSYILEKNELQNTLDITNEELKEYKKLLDEKIAYISMLESNIHIDTVISVVDSIIYISPNKVSALFSYNDAWLNITGSNDITLSNTGNIQHMVTNLDDIYINTPLRVGLTDDYTIWVETDNPYMRFTNIEGAVVDGSALMPKKHRFGLSMQSGWGVMYDLIDNDISTGLYMGFGVHMKLF